GIMVAAVHTPIFGLSHGPRPLNALFVVALCLLLAWLVMEVAARLPSGAKRERRRQATDSSLPGPMASPTGIA
ncbi:MAG TPA: hypothetical protein VGL35_01690, partial [Rhizomicrobium sp.]